MAQATLSDLALFRSQLRESMTSPVALLLAAGVDFAMGPPKESASAEALPVVARIGLLPTAMSMVSLAGSMMTLWQGFSPASQPTRKNTSA